jgi:hypothetical protein
MTNNFHVAIRTGQMGVYIWGNITYDDSFGKSHHTAFRLWTDAIPDAGKNEIASMHFCDEGNDSD